MPGILKKKKGSKSRNKVRFNKDVKDWDGLSSKNRAWYNFIDLVYNLNIQPKVAWNRVPDKHIEHEWEIIKYTVGRMEKRDWSYSMPMGSRKKLTMFSLKSDDTTMHNLMYFVYNYEEQMELKKKREELINHYSLGKFCKKLRKRKNEEKRRNEEKRKNEEKRINEKNRDKLKHMLVEKVRKITEKMRKKCSK